MNSVLQQHLKEIKIICLNSKVKIANNKKYPIKKMELVENKKQSSNFRYCVRASNTFSRFRTFSVITSSINVSNLGRETIRPRNSGVV